MRFFHGLLYCLKSKNMTEILEFLQSEEIARFRQFVFNNTDPTNTSELISINDPCPIEFGMTELHKARNYFEEHAG
jgi:hypothetical protein